MIIFDLDGTLADHSHRLLFVDPAHDPNAEYIYDDLDDLGQNLSLSGHLYIKGTQERWKRNYEQFYQNCDNDKPIFPLLLLMRRVSQFEHVQIWTGRSESVRQKTIWWFDKHLTCFAPKDWFEKNLKMRPLGDHTPDHELKEKWLDDYMKNNDIPIEMVFEDRTRCVEMWRRRGIKCLQVANGDF